MQVKTVRMMLQRKESQFRNFIEPGGRFPPEGVAQSCTLFCTALPGSAQAGLFTWPGCVCNYVSAGVRRVAQLMTWLAAAAGRYHLYISLACPWANRCLAVRNLKVRAPSPASECHSTGSALQHQGFLVLCRC